MPLIFNPRSELIREPNLLIPNKKPVGPVRFDWGNNVGLIPNAAFVDHSYDLVSNKSVGPTDTSAYWCLRGSAYIDAEGNFANDGTEPAGIVTEPKQWHNGELSIILVFTMFDIIGNQYLFGLENDISGERDCNIKISTDEIQFGYWQSDSFSTLKSILNVAANTKYILGVTYRSTGTSNIRMFINGELDNSKTDAASLDSDSPKMSIGGAARQSTGIAMGSSMHGLIHTAYVIPEPLTDEQHFEIAQDLYQVVGV